MGTDVANMEDSYVEEGYDDYGGYEGQGYEAEDGREYGDQENAGAGQQGEQKYDLFHHDATYEKHY